MTRSSNIDEPLVCDDKRHGEMKGKDQNVCEGSWGTDGTLLQYPFLLHEEVGKDPERLDGHKARQVTATAFGIQLSWIEKVCRGPRSKSQLWYHLLE